MSEELVDAIAAVQSDWMASIARATDGRVWEQDGLRCVAKSGELTICFPERLPRPALDGVLAWADERSVTVACWTAREMPAEMAGTLASHGFEEGWWPHWMAIGAQSATTDPRITAATEVPEFDDYGQALLTMVSERTAAFVAREDGRLAGFAWVHAPAGSAVAGIFDVVVFEPFRRRGLGRALTAAACSRAAELGCTHVALNATVDGERLYRAMGFDSLGFGRTWWRHACG